MNYSEEKNSDIWVRDKIYLSSNLPYPIFNHFSNSISGENFLSEEIGSDIC